VSVVDHGQSRRLPRAKEASTVAASHPAEQALPDTALFWRWVAAATRPVVGWVLTALGALAILFGYLGLSRKAFVGEQLPYLISGGIGGMVLVIVGGVFLATEDIRRNLARVDDLQRTVGELAELVTDLHSVLLALPESEEVRRERPGNGAGNGHAALLALPDGTRYHRPGCPMVEGKPAAAPISAAAAQQRAMQPCAVCNPEAAIR
jgi:hypothetical protein